MPRSRLVRRPDPIDYVALANFRATLRRFLAFSEQEAEAVGLTSHQHQALLMVKGHRGPAAMTVGELARRLVLRQNSAVELVDRLEHAGLLRRTRDPQDRRCVVLVLTPSAQARLRALSLAHLAELARIGPLLAGALASLGEAPQPEAVVR